MDTLQPITYVFLRRRYDCMVRAFLRVLGMCFVPKSKHRIDNAVTTSLYLVPYDVQNPSVLHVHACLKLFPLRHRRRSMNEIPVRITHNFYTHHFVCIFCHIRGYNPHSAVYSDSVILMLNVGCMVQLDSTEVYLTL